ncbi:MAG: SlyX family protein [Gammaproteobacteria bacterium]|nr:SlyX family protein [Gammaproteobacteria bacterium]
MERIEELESRQAFQEDLLQKLDDALDYQSRRILDLEDRVRYLLSRIEELEEGRGDDDGMGDEGRTHRTTSTHLKLTSTGAHMKAVIVGDDKSLSLG